MKKNIYIIFCIFLSCFAGILQAYEQAAPSESQAADAPQGEAQAPKQEAQKAPEVKQNNGISSWFGFGGSDGTYFSEAVVTVQYVVRRSNGEKKIVTRELTRADPPIEMGNNNTAHYVVRDSSVPYYQLILAVLGGGIACGFSGFYAGYKIGSGPGRDRHSG